MVPGASPDIKPQHGPGSPVQCTRVCFVYGPLGRDADAHICLQTAAFVSGRGLCGSGSEQQAVKLHFHVLLTLDISTSEPPAISGCWVEVCREATSLQGLSLLKGQGGIPQSHKSKMSAHKYVRSLFR